MTQFYTTGQAAQETGIPEGTIRSWMSRRPGAFIVGTDIIVEDSGRKLWTEVGLQALLQQRSGEGSEAEAIETSAMDEILNQLLDVAATQLSIKYFEQLPMRTLRRIQMMMAHPTEEERDIVQRAVDAALAQGTKLLTPEYTRLTDGD